MSVYINQIVTGRMFGKTSILVDRAVIALLRGLNVAYLDTRHEARQSFAAAVAERLKMFNTDDAYKVTSGGGGLVNIARPEPQINKFFGVRGAGTRYVRPVSGADSLAQYRGYEISVFLIDNAESVATDECTIEEEIFKMIDVLSPGAGGSLEVWTTCSRALELPTTM